jgi:DNA-binding GntR family transcriptional regulator
MQTAQPFQTKEEYAYQSLRKAILTCELKPEEKLVIDRLSIELGISQIPIRAAMQRLSAEGLVVITPHSGAVVSPISLGKVREVFSLLEVLEQAAFRAASEKISPASLLGLQQIVAELDQAAAQGDLRGWAGLNIRFHRQIAALSEMPLLMEFTHRVLDDWQRLVNCYVQHLPPPRLLAAQADHRHILDALRTQNFDQLQSIAVTHNRQAYQTYLPFLKQDK